MHVSESCTRVCMSCECHVSQVNVYVCHVSHVTVYVCHVMQQAAMYVICNEKRDAFEQAKVIEGDMKTYCKNMNSPNFFGGMHTHTHAHTNPDKLSYTTHTHAHGQSNTHTHLETLPTSSAVYSPCTQHTHSLSLSLSYTHTYTITHTSTHPHTRTHTHTHHPRISETMQTLAHYTHAPSCTNKATQNLAG